MIYPIGYVRSRNPPPNMFGQVFSPTHMFKHVPPPPVTQTVYKHDVSYNVQLLLISMTHKECNLKQCTANKNSDYILRHVWARTPPPVTQTVYKHDVI